MYIICTHSWHFFTPLVGKDNRHRKVKSYFTEKGNRYSTVQCKSYFSERYLEANAKSSRLRKLPKLSARGRVSDQLIDGGGGCWGVWAVVIVTTVFMCENGGTGVLCEHYAQIKSKQKPATTQNEVNNYDMKCNYRVLFGPLNTVQRGGVLRNANQLYIVPHNYATLRRLPLFNFPNIWNNEPDEKHNPVQHRYLKNLKKMCLVNLL